MAKRVWAGQTARAALKITALSRMYAYACCTTQMGRGRLAVLSSLPKGVCGDW